MTTIPILLKRNSMLILLGILLEFGFLAWLLITASSTWNLLPLVFFALFSTYILGLFYAKRKLRGNAALVIIAFFAILFRLTLLFSAPVLSTDIYRYYWEGKVVANGYNPYVYSPDAPQLASLRDPIWEVLNLKFLTASYPPLLELLFAIVYITFRSLFGYKIVFFIFDLGLVGVISLTLRELNLNSTNVVVYAWAPLPIIEVSQTGHNDPVTVLLLFVFFWLFLRARNFLSAHVLGLSVLSKLYPIFLAPVLFRRWGNRASVIFLLTVIAFYAPIAGLGLGVFNGLLFAINTSYFNGSLFPGIVALLSMIGIFANPGFAAQALTYVIYLAILLWIVLVLQNKMDQRRDVVKISFILVGALLLVNRSFFPWYIIWIVPFLAFYTSPSWLLLSGTIFMGYMKYGSFPPPSFETVDPQTRLLIDVAQYVPFYLLLMYELFRSCRGSTRVRLSPETRSTDLEHLQAS